MRHRDPLECIQALLRNPTFEGKWTFSARWVYEDPNRQNRIYSDWMTSDSAWSAQVSTYLTLLIDTALNFFTSRLFHKVEHSLGLLSLPTKQTYWQQQVTALHTHSSLPLRTFLWIFG